MLEHLILNLLHMGLNTQDIIQAVMNEIPEVGYVQVLDAINNLRS